MIVDFRKKPPTHPPLVINNSSVTVVDHFKFLGTTITNTLKWDNNITQLVRKRLQISPPIMVQFYRAVIESVLTSALSRSGLPLRQPAQRPGYKESSGQQSRSSAAPCPPSWTSTAPGALTEL